MWIEFICSSFIYLFTTLRLDLLSRFIQEIRIIGVLLVIEPTQLSNLEILHTLHGG